MALKCGIIGLPNVGKSTLFNALTNSAIAEASNYPFCTIEPNSGIVSVPDHRLQQLMAIVHAQKIIPATIEFIDIAGLVAGASKGEGLGNKFLAHIREVDAVLHVLRCFDDSNVTHVYNTVDPMRDAEIIETELILADFESVEHRMHMSKKRFKSGDKELKNQIELLEAVSSCLAAGKSARNLLTSSNQHSLYALQLLTVKPVLYVCNVLEHEAIIGNSFTQCVEAKAVVENAECVIISSRIEAEIAVLSTIEERQEYLSSIGLTETGLNKIIRASYSMLGLQSFFTVGPKEIHAWTYKIGASAAKAAGIIHSDFEKGFIRAEVISYNDYIKYHGEIKAKEAGKMRLEGKDYKVQDGDVVHFRFNV